ncbi:MAG: BamA/TamA family outer membrane protein [Gemmatimonadota bacterium]
MRSIGGWSNRGQATRRLLGGMLVAGALGASLPASATAQAQPLMVRGLSFSGNHAIDATTLAAAIATTNSSAFARWGMFRWLGLGDKRYFNEQDFRRDILRVQLVYRRSGYLEVKVDTVVHRTPTDISITFVIAEGPPVRVDQLQVTGLDSLAEDEADKLVLDLPLASGDVFSRYVLEAARDTLRLRLQNTGFPSAAVTGRFGVDSSQRIARVTLEARPGTRAVFGTSHVTGQDQVDSAFIASLLTARPGRPYRLEEIYRSQRALYGSSLFRFANVTIDSAQFTDSSTRVPLVVAVTEGKMHRATASVGYATTDCFRMGAGWTARNFLGGGRIVDLTTQLSKIGVGAPLDFGAGRNICSSLKEDSIGSRKANYGVTLSLRKNGFLSPDNALVVSLFSERRSEYKVYLREEVGTSVAITRETYARIPVTLAYRFGYGTTDANAVSFCAFFNACVASDIAQLRERRILATLSLNATRQRVNNLLDPSRGTVLSAQATVSSRFIGSSDRQQFFRLVGDAAVYFPLSRSIVLAGHVRAGAIYAPLIDLGSGSRANFVPPDQRFYAGGPNDVRGYDRNELGPVVYVVRDSSVNEDGVPDVNAVRVAATGGNRTAVANLELRMPSPIFSQRLRFAAFVDAGTLWEGGGAAPIRVTPGVGLRFASPLGPVRFDVGYNAYRLQSGALYAANSTTGELSLINPSYVKDRGRHYTLHFSVGQAF